jgi:hypothetical protein
MEGVMTAPSEIDAAPVARDDDLSPHISNALDRIESGWIIRYLPACEWPWEVYRSRLELGGWVLRQVGVVFETPAEARAEYLRLSAREE